MVLCVLLLAEQQTLVTVLIPVYNGQGYLRKALDSAVAQTLRAPQLEILVVDDGSTDNTSAILAEYAAKHSSVVVETLPQNQGTFGARSAGIRKAKGSFVLFLDADDELYTPKIAEVAFKRANATGADVLHYNEIATLDNLTKLYAWANPQGFDEKLGQAALRWYLQSGRGTSFHGKLVKKSLLVRVLDVLGDAPREQRMQFCEDILVMVAAYSLSEKYVALNYTGYHYFFRWDSVSGEAHTNFSKAAKMSRDTIFAEQQLEKLLDKKYHAQLRERFAKIVTTALEEIKGWPLDPICALYEEAKIMRSEKWLEIKQKYCGVTEWNKDVKRDL